MPFEIVRNDIVNMHVDAIVNTANPYPTVGSGVDSRIHQAAGPRLLEARKAIGILSPGQCGVTPAFGLHAKHVLHVSGPVWEGGSHGEADCLRQCYDNALKEAQKLRCGSVAFPLLSTGNYGFPKSLALQIAIEAFSHFLLRHEMQIYLVVFTRSAFSLSEKLFHSVQSFIDERYVEETQSIEYKELFRREYCPSARFQAPAPDLFDMESTFVCAEQSLEELLEETDAGFSETLLKLIDHTGKKDSEVYKKANVDRKLFSKIRNNPSYQPSKTTAVGFAMALELSLEETKDLIGRAGFALTHSSKFDIIVEYFITHQNYNVIELNEVLFAFDQMLIGG